ncbi:Secreted effector protein PipB2 (plasmid) [Streptomyces xanthophaeus]|nr:Secreted effector protein PipB2 [Streptomyces xanthophaeus]
MVSVLSAYIRERAPRTGTYPEMDVNELAAPVKPEVRAAVDVLASRPAEKDGRARIDWTFTDLRGLELKTRRFSLTVDRDEKAPNLNFKGANLTEADLRHSILVGLDMNGAFLRHTNLSYATVGDIGLIDAYMSHAVMEGMTALNGTIMYCARMADVVANDAKFVGTDLAATDLTAAELKNADLRGASLAGSNLTNAKLNKANLEGAHLGSAPNWSFGYGQPPAALLGADLTGANLRNANLAGVYFGPPRKGEQGANLTDADLTGANLTGADLTGAVLTGAQVTDQQIASAKRDEKIVEYPVTCQREKYHIPTPSFGK